MKKITAILLSVVCVLALSSCGKGGETSVNVISASPKAETSEPVSTEETEPETLIPAKNIIVLYVNDVHCGIDDNLGYKDLATVKNVYKTLGYEVLLVDNGDAIQGDVIGTLSKGEYIIDIMNEVGFDAAIPGNHEFDYGMDRFLELTKKADFSYLSCNFTGIDGKAVLDAYKIFDIGGVKIAFVGISTPKTLTSSTPKYFKNDAGEFIYSFEQDETGEKLYTCVQNAVDSARAEGADYVFAMAHLGTEEDCSPWTSTEVIQNTTGIDAVLDGHSHSVWEEELMKNKDGKDVILTSTGTKLANIGVLTLSSDGTIHTSLINDLVDSENSMSSLIADIKGKNDELIAEVVAHSDVELCAYDPVTNERLVRLSETNLGDFCADAYRILGEADVAIINGGGIRASLPAGDITYGDIIKVFPFGNNMCVCEATGEEIYEALEMSASKLPAESGGFLQVSGVNFTIDLNVESPVVRDESSLFVKLEGEPRVKDILIGGEPLDLSKTYTLASYDYELKNMGDGYTMFADNVYTQDSVMIDNQVLINYIVDYLEGNLSEEYSDPYGAGRITIIE